MTPAHSLWRSAESERERERGDVFLQRERCELNLIITTIIIIFMDISRSQITTLRSLKPGDRADSKQKQSNDQILNPTFPSLAVHPAHEIAALRTAGQLSKGAYSTAAHYCYNPQSAATTKSSTNNLLFTSRKHDDFSSPLEIHVLL